jgi:hypothetical protein
VGPEKGMGTRETSEGYDLNRDFIKLDTQEARAMVGLIDRLNPHMFIDCHTTNGSKHQYELTYDIPHNPSSAEPIRTMMREVMMPKITANLSQRGIDTFYYGNFNRDNTKWTTYGFEPRYSTEYVGMRGRISVLSEAYSYISYEERVRVSREFVVECIDYLGANAAAIKTLLAEVEADWMAKASANPSNLQLHLQAELVPFDQPFQIMGYRDGQPQDYTVQFVGNYAPVVSRDVPHAYVFDKQMVRVAERLRAHGIKVGTLSKPINAKTEDSQIVKINRSSRPFQKHLMTQLDVDVTVGERDWNQGDFVVLTAQPLGRLAGYILEASTNDGFVTWNHLDEYIKEGERYPISRFRMSKCWKSK